MLDVFQQWLRRVLKIPCEDYVKNKEVRKICMEPLSCEVKSRRKERGKRRDRERVGNITGDAIGGGGLREVVKLC